MEEAVDLSSDRLLIMMMSCYNTLSCCTLHCYLLFCVVLVMYVFDYIYCTLTLSPDVNPIAVFIYIYIHTHIVVPRSSGICGETEWS